MSEITVFTPTYNRASTLIRAYDSLENQTNKDFVWLVIDDGSTDNTREIVNSIIRKASFKIDYHYKSNGGRHTAVNYSYQFLSTKYVITLDSDDELLPRTIETVLNIWSSISEADHERFWCITGREVDSVERKLIGKPFPAHINRFTGRKQRKIIMRFPGEKHCCRKVEIHKQYKFPEYDDTKYVSENMVWELINRRYDQYCTNEIFGKYYINSAGSLSSNSPHKKSKYRSGYYRSLFYINEIFDEILFNKAVAICLFDVSRCAIITGEKLETVLKSINMWYKKVLVVLGYPISAMWCILNRSQIIALKSDR